MDWSPIVDRWKNSVLQIIVYHAHYDVLRPYSNPDDVKARGTGFIVDIRRGLVVTNAHVAANSISILGRSNLTGKVDLSLELVGISRDRDLAICKLSDASKQLLIEDVNAPEVLNMKFGDDMLLSQTEEVMAIGYPLGKENIKVTTGVVSGFQFEENDKDEDVGLQNPSYIQITAAINPGNSGGPLLNKKGEVVGINAAGYRLMQNVGYAIGSRALLSIFGNILLGGQDETMKVMRMPQFSIKWNKSNPSLNKIKCGDPRYSGVYVYEILKDSIFDKLEEGDIISRILYQDPFWTSQEAFDITDIGPNKSSLLKKPNDMVLGDFDNFGDISLYKCDDRAPGQYGRRLLDRKIQLDDLRDIIPIGAVVQLHICRNGSQWLAITAKYEPVNIYRIGLQYLHIDPMPYLIFAGIVVSPLTLNHIHHFPESLSKYTDIEKSFNKYLIIVQIFPNTTASYVGALQTGDILDKVNGDQVRTLLQLDEAVRATGDLITIKTIDKKLFVVDKASFVPEDLRSIKDYKIKDYNYCL